MSSGLASHGASSTAAVVFLGDAADPLRFGCKAAALAELIAHGFDIPAGFVIPVGVEPAPVEIAEALGRLGNGPVAVRSSGVVEDLPDSAHAGQYTSVLDVRGADAVLSAAAEVRRSAGPDGAMAVLVQTMIDADAAGVAFSANPLTGERGVAVVSATRGLGDRLMAGESDGDEWFVRDDGAHRTSRSEPVLDAARASDIAALARRVEHARGRPQDIEWAVREGRLLLLQARPITVLPVAPHIEPPKGTWQKDASHFSEPVSPFAATAHMLDGTELQTMIDDWGLLPDGAAFRVIGHEMYVHIEPDDGGKKPPPWWVLAILARVVPSMRRKLKAAQRAEDTGLLDSLPVVWESELKPHIEAEIRRHASRDLAALGDTALFEHLDELSAFCRRNIEVHFRLNMPHVVGVFELSQVCSEHLGWDVPQAMELLQGLSVASSAPSRDLGSIASLARQRPEARAVIESRPADIVSALDAVDPELAGRLRDHLTIWGLRTFGGDAGRPSVAECTDVFADALADLMDDAPRADPAERRRQLVADARARLSDERAREKFDRALAYAERTYPMREDNVILTYHLAVGLLRRVALEAGRRLVKRGALLRAADAVMLTATELRQAVVDGADASATKEVVLRRKAEQAWVRAHPGPAVYGPAPGPPPDLRGLPRAARRFNEALLWELAQEINATDATGGDALGGIAASPGVYRGRVRVVRAAHDLGRLRAKEVLVCPETSSAWMLVFRRAGALVTDHGSALSHTAIVAREFGLPAVVATGHATTTLCDGDEVIVDGNRGTVTRC